jgi:UTP-glucose-1-phosphate uridylyltransferase
MKPTLLILAAGLGSRYGGVKQMDALGPGGESIIDYSVFDAIRAGFGKIVFVVNEKIEADFKEIWEPKLKGRIDHCFVIQDPNDLPKGYSLPSGRLKPWGTGQAVLAARNEINTPFAVINADDFYGSQAYEQSADFLQNVSEPDQYCMLGYLLQHTLSQHGAVSRGVCSFDEDDLLTKITEITAIEKRDELVGYENSKGEFIQLDHRSRISMNFWGFKPGIFNYLSEAFESFLQGNINNDKAEFLLPTVINALVDNKLVSVKMLKTEFDWFGVTYREDKAQSKTQIKRMIHNGEYPLSLWR